MPRLRRSPATVHSHSQVAPPITTPCCDIHWGPSPCGRLSRPRTTTAPPPHPASSADDAPAPAPPLDTVRSGANTGWFPRSLLSIRDRRRPALPLRHRHGYAAGFHRDLPVESQTHRPRSSPPPPARGGCAPQSSPDPPGLELAHVLEGLYTLVPCVRLCPTLAGPAPSGSAGTSRLCQGCFPPSPASPGSGCPQLQQSCCDTITSESFHLQYG